METYRTVEILKDSQGAVALQALARHLDRMEQRDQEPSGEYMRVVFMDPKRGETAVRWPIPMPKRGDNIELGYN